MSSFSDMLKYLREREGQTQAELAKTIGVSRSRIGMYETEEREPDLEMLEILSDHFNVDMNFLLGKQREMPPYLKGSKKELVLNVLESLPPEGQDAALEYIQYLLAKYKDNPK